MRIDFLSSDGRGRIVVGDCGSDSGLGRLGMCRMPGADFEELEQDLALIKAVRPAFVVCLLSGVELDIMANFRRDSQGVVERMREAGLVVRHFPIPMFSTPIPESREEAVRLVLDIAAAFVQGKTVVVHCQAGLGRTGMIVACCLVALGVRPLEAIATVRAARANTIETREQEEFVETFEAARSRGKT